MRHLNCFLFYVGTHAAFQNVPPKCGRPYCEFIFSQAARCLFLSLGEHCHLERFINLTTASFKGRDPRYSFQ